jgi:hypothetical protein
MQLWRLIVQNWLASFLWWSMISPMQMMKIALKMGVATREGRGRQFGEGRVAMSG